MTGNFWAFEEFVTSERLNKSNDRALDGQAELAYKTLDAASSFDNSDSTMAEKTTDADGINGTINIGSTTATFDTDKYDLSSGLIENFGGTFNDSSATATLNGTAQTNNVYLNRFLVKYSSGLNQSFTVSILKNGTTTIYNQTIAPSITGNPATFVLDPADYTEYLDNTDTFAITFTQVGGGQFARDTSASGGASVIVISGGQSFGDTGALTEFTTLNNSSGEVVMDTNTLEALDTDKYVSLYWKGDLPTNTSASYDFSDGTTTINLPVDSITKVTGVIDISSLGAATNYTITAKLVTTNPVVTPTWSGCGVRLLR